MADAAIMMPSEVSTEDYAGFWVRFFAACIDLILYTPLYIGMMYLFDFMFAHTAGVSLVNAEMDFTGGATQPSELYRWSFESMFGVVALVSYAGLFSSRWQGSPGMYLLGFRVTDVKGLRISFGRAFAWGFTGSVGWLICCAGILYMQKDIMAARDMLQSCNEQNIGVQDCIPEIEKIIGIPFATFQELMFAATGLTFFLFIIWALSIALPKDKTGFHNLICGTRFLKGRP